MPWCETLRKWVNWTLHWLGYFWPWLLTLNVQDQIVSREWEARMSWKEGDGGRYDALMWNTTEMSQQDAALTGVLLTFAFDLEFSRSNCISGMGGPIVMEWKGWESIGCLDVTSRQMKLLGTGWFQCRRFRRLILVVHCLEINTYSAQSHLLNPHCLTKTQCLTWVIPLRSQRVKGGITDQSKICTVDITEKWNVRVANG